MSAHTLREKMRWATEEYRDEWVAEIERQVKTGYDHIQLDWPVGAENESSWYQMKTARIREAVEKFMAKHPGVVEWRDRILVVVDKDAFKE